VKKILILFDESRPVDSYPYVLNFIKLIHRKYKIDFLVSAKMYSEYCLENLRLCKAAKSSYTKSAVHHLWKHGNEYSAVIAYSVEGVWAVCFHNIFRSKIPFAYFSMELYDIDKKCPGIISAALRLFGGLSTDMLKFSVVQDQKRADIFRGYFPSASKIFLLPNSYIGYTNEKSDFACKKFNIPRDKKILLYTGALEKWGYDINLAMYLNKLLEKDYVLLLSGFSRDGYTDVILSEYSDLIKTKKVIVNEQILDECEYTELVKSAYIGLAWYVKLDRNLCSRAAFENIYYMGLSSGKLCKYLSCSVPVVAPSFYPGYKEIIEDKKIGKVCSYSEEMSEKILEIASDYNYYRNNVENVYKNELEYSKQAGSLTDELDRIIGDSRLSTLGDPRLWNN
jgi:glycosyltransferase involved in cell wall biosynthesis